jgi:hypothetical protein
LENSGTYSPIGDAVEAALSLAADPLFPPKDPVAQPRVKLSDVQKTAVQQDTIAENDPDFLRRVWKCSSCEFDDEAARSEQSPWCQASAALEIDSSHCNGFRPKVTAKRPSSFAGLVSRVMDWTSGADIQRRRG